MLYQIVMFADASYKICIVAAFRRTVRYTVFQKSIPPNHHTHTHTHTLNGFFQDNLGKLAPER